MSPAARDSTAVLPGAAECPNRSLPGTGLRRLFSLVKYENLVAGLSGGVVSTLVLHPLDLVKIRFAGKGVECKTCYL